MLYNRKITPELLKWLPEKEMLFLNGPRQVGKTSLLKIIEKELIASGVSAKNIFYLNLEELKVLAPLNQDPENILDYVVNKEDRNYFLLDEIQYLDNPSNFLKHLYDKYAPKIKIIATGSSSLELKAKIQDSLAGRKIDFLITPLDFEEYLWFQESDFLEYFKKTNIPPAAKQHFEKTLEMYLIYGGLPAVVLQKDHDKKKQLLESYVSTYINKDIRAIGKIENISGFNSTTKVLASQIGNLLNINELCNTLDIHRRRLENYLELLEYTFVLHKVLPYQKNIRTQITKMPKVYFFDIGIRNALLGNFLPLESRADTDALFENSIFLNLQPIFRDKIYFYRALNKTEVDFVLEKETKTIPIEVKYKRLKTPVDHRIIEHFMEKTHAETGYVANLSFNNTEKSIQYMDYRLLPFLA